jgi:hypothetical protein
MVTAILHKPTGHATQPLNFLRVSLAHRREPRARSRRRDRSNVRPPSQEGPQDGYFWRRLRGHVPAQPPARALPPDWRPGIGKGGLGMALMDRNLPDLVPHASSGCPCCRGPLSSRTRGAKRTRAASVPLAIRVVPALHREDRLGLRGLQLHVLRPRSPTGRSREVVQQVHGGGQGASPEAAGEEGTIKLMDDMLPTCRPLVRFLRTPPLADRVWVI